MVEAREPVARPGRKGQGLHEPWVVLGLVPEVEAERVVLGHAVPGGIDANVPGLVGDGQGERAAAGLRAGELEVEPSFLLREGHALSLRVAYGRHGEGLRVEVDRAQPILEGRQRDRGLATEGARLVVEPQRDAVVLDIVRAEGRPALGPAPDVDLLRGGRRATESEGGGERQSGARRSHGSGGSAGRFWTIPSPPRTRAAISSSSEGTNGPERLSTPDSVTATVSSIRT